MNSLLNLFKDTLSTIDLELFEKLLKTPKIVVNSKIYKKFIKNKEESKFTVDKNDIIKFNSIFSENEICTDISLNLEEEDYDEYEEEKEENTGMEKSENLEEEEDEDQYEEDNIKNFDENTEHKETSEDDSENDDICEIKESVNFEHILNKEIMKKLFELYDNKENNVKSNNIFIMKSKEYSIGLEKFLEEHNLI